jgi:Protein of unknown function (DUF4240)
MTQAEFWELIDKTKKSDSDEHVERLEAKLLKLSVPELLWFGHWWDKFHTEAYRWNLWGAAYLMNSGCSDDGFIDFRSWLILKGETVFRASLLNPESLTKVRVEPDEASCECYPAPNAYTQLVAGTDHSDYYTALDAAHGQSTDLNEPLGEEWDFDNETEMKARLPKLFKKFGNS